MIWSVFRTRWVMLSFLPTPGFVPLGWSELRDSKPQGKTELGLPSKCQEGSEQGIACFVFYGQRGLVWNPWSHAMLGQENGISRAWVSSIKHKWGDLMWLYSPANSPGRKINRFWGWAAAGGKAGTIRRAALTCEELVFLLWTSANLNELFIIGNLGFSLMIYSLEVLNTGDKFNTGNTNLGLTVGCPGWWSSSNTTAGHSLSCIRN